MAEIPTIALWMGEPISKMSRGELEREFCKAHEKIAQMEREICERSVANIRALAAMARGR
jgi:hypothetical protein